MLPVREHATPERPLVLWLHGLSDHDERIGTCFAVGYDVIWRVEVSLIDILGWNEIVDFDRVRTLDRSRRTASRSYADFARCFFAAGRSASFASRPRRRARTAASS